MFVLKSRSHTIKRSLVLLAVSFFLVSNGEGCARLPYTTKTIHEDRRVEVKLQHEVSLAGYTHPVRLSSADLGAILKGFSVRKQKTFRLRWFGEEVPPEPVFREDEIAALSSHLATGLLSAGSEERVHFELFSPGMNPSNERDVTAGWVAIRDPYFYFVIEYFHVQVPLRKSDQYDYNYPTPPPLAGSYLLSFEPGRFWVGDQNQERVLDYRAFLKTATGPRSGNP
ncbi:hypothetical protein [Petrachloros mirabilis]